jgi:hypothetical protein
MLVIHRFIDRRFQMFFFIFTIIFILFLNSKKFENLKETEILHLIFTRPNEFLTRSIYRLSTVEINHISRIFVVDPEATTSTYDQDTEKESQRKATIGLLLMEKDKYNDLHILNPSTQDVISRLALEAHSLPLGVKYILISGPDIHVEWKNFHQRISLELHSHDVCFGLFHNGGTIGI